ncbi:MAG: peptide deformylase [Alphaproteobacteria bacterium]|nr:peptide deformylase [Alphaproteobacteria bacterium]
MAILKIARMGHPILRQVAQPVEDATSPEIRRLLADMVETMGDADGTGLAAPQVYAPLRVVVYFVTEARAGKDQAAVPLTSLINPIITPIGEEIAYDWEGCLSVPDMVGIVPRHTRIRLQAETPEGKPIDAMIEGFHARVLQHECDHLDGILYPQRMDDLSLLIFREELRHGVPEKAKRLLAPSA